MTLTSMYPVFVTPVLSEGSGADEGVTPEAYSESGGEGAGVSADESCD